MNAIDRKLSEKYNPRFGKIAVEKGFVTPEQVKAALQEQLDDDFADRPHRLLGRILFDHGWITFQQIETVLNELFRFNLRQQKYCKTPVYKHAPQ